MSMYTSTGLGLPLIITGVVLGPSDEVLDTLLSVFRCPNSGVSTASAPVFRSTDNLFSFTGSKGER